MNQALALLREYKAMTDSRKQLLANLLVYAFCAVVIWWAMK